MPSSSPPRCSDRRCSPGGLALAGALAAAGATGVAASAPALAQDNYEIQVYSAETVAPGATMIELHSNYTFRGGNEAEQGVRPTAHALHETLEVTHGFSPWFEAALYTFTSAQAGHGWNWVGNHL